MGEIKRKYAKLSKSDVQGKTLMVNYCEIKVGGCREEYIVYCNGNEWSGLGWFRMDWVERGNCPL